MFNIGDRIDVSGLFGHVYNGKYGPLATVVGIHFEDMMAVYVDGYTYLENDNHLFTKEMAKDYNFKLVETEYKYVPTNEGDKETDI